MVLIAIWPINYYHRHHLLAVKQGFCIVYAAAALKYFIHQLFPSHFSAHHCLNDRLCDLNLRRIQLIDPSACVLCLSQNVIQLPHKCKLFC
mgnify:CR=1 FL=1